jgi:uncharacterized protein YfdQ (DUF2303 family)
MSNDGQFSDAAAIIDSIERLSKVQFETIDGRTIAVVPTKQGKELRSVKALIDEYQVAPDRRKGTATFNEPKSFADHVNRMKNENTALFACVDRSNPSVLAVYDYHDLEGGGAHFCQHRALYPFPVSAEWKAWSTMDGSKMNQRQFCEFVEDRIPDLVNPSEVEIGPSTAKYLEALDCEVAKPRDVIGLSRELAVRVEQECVNAVSLSSGQGQVQFKEFHKDVNGAPLVVPGVFLIDVPIFLGGDSSIVPVRLRYRAKEGVVTWWYQLALVDLLFRDAIDIEIEKLREAVARPIFIGSPEVVR